MAQDPEEDFNALPRGIRTRISAVILAAVLIALTLVYLLSGGGAEFFHRKIFLHAYLADSGGLAPGLDVMLNGVKVGLVRSVRLAGTSDPTRVVRIELKIEERYRSDIPVDSIAAVTATNLVGDTYVNISAGKSATHVEDGAEIASLIQTGSFNPADLVASLRTTIDTVNTILDGIQKGDTPLAQTVRGSDLYLNLVHQVEQIQKTIRIYSDPRTPTGKMLFSDEFYNQIRQPILNIDHALEEIQRGETPAGKLINDSSAYDNAVSRIRSVHQTLVENNAGKGSAGALLKSDDQYRQIQAQLRAIDQSVDTLTHGDGAVAQLLQSAQLYDALAGQSGNTRTFLHEFRDNPQKFLRIKIF